MTTRKNKDSGPFDSSTFLTALLAGLREEVLLTDPDFRVLARSQAVSDPASILATVGVSTRTESGAPSASEEVPRRIDSSTSEPDSKRVRPVRNARGETLGYLVFGGTDAFDSVDPLTGVADRRRLESEFKRRRVVDRRTDSPLSLIFIDLDGFKPFNDSFGHLVGDQILLQFACLLQNHFREGDLVARFGGDEFVVLCSNCPAPVAENRIRVLREKLAGQYVVTTFPGTPEPACRHILSFCYGIVEADSLDSFEEAVSRADKSLYQMKKSQKVVLT